MLIKFIFLLFSFFVLVQSACFDNGDKEVRGLCYKFVPQKLAYEDARNWCHYQNPVTSSYLAYVPDASTSSFLASYARTAFGSNNVNFWIGLSRNNSNRQWFWDNGASVGFTYFDILGSGNYVAESTVNAKWNTFLGTEVFYFACSYDPQAPPTFAPPKTTTIANVPVSTPPVPTTTDDIFCSPTQQPQTVLFAYSNDFLPKTVLDSWNKFITNGVYYYSWFGSVRFDIENIDIQFHGKEDVNSTIPNNLPNPNQGFQNSSIGSNVFNVIEKFFSNTQAPVCGSRILVLLKRYPNEADTARLVSLIRSHHAILHVITSATPSGGFQPKTMYSVASKTNGMGLFEYDAYFYLTVMWFPLYGYPYPVYATTIQVSGSGTKTLPDFYPAIEDWYMLAISFQDHFPDDSFQNLTLRWLNSQDSGNVSFNSIQIPTTGNYLAVGVYWHYLDYKMTLDYNYLDQDVQNLQIRIYSKIPLNNWLPYSD